MARVFTITEGLENMGAMKTGGQGSVYKGRRIGEIITAIKLLPTPVYSESAADKNFIAFQNEVQKLKKVNEEPNPHVVKILSSGITESGNFPFIEMEYIEGPDLEELLKPPHEPVFTLKEVLKVADQLSSALAHCHKINVRHGDIKSNNVKYNINTGNYVLLDFGLAIMSDEQRRTSLRHAGAIEFMAPEQSEGQMLFQTDIYSFGIVLYEMLAGSVPFPLKDKGETARNAIVVAHLEKVPPDVLYVRKEALPENWSLQKKQDEMQVPQWLINVIYKCLEKKPEDRYANGTELHQYIWQHTISNERGDGQILLLEEENKRLRRDNEQMQKQLAHFNSFAGNSKLFNPVTTAAPIENKKPVKKKSSPGSMVLMIFVAFLVLGILVYFLVNGFNSKPSISSQSKVLGEYIITSPRAYFYTDPEEKSPKNGFAAASDQHIKAFDKSGAFIYTEINENGQALKGWLLKKDLMPAEDRAQRAAVLKTAKLPVKPETAAQLRNAKQFLSENKMVEALIIYNSLSKQEVPEAMYQYAKLALQDKNNNISCGEAFDLLKRSAAFGYIPAKRTLGFLYSFADDKQMLQQSNYYNRCKFGKNAPKGSQLLLEATLQGDTTASRLLDEINAKN